MSQVLYTKPFNVAEWDEHLRRFDELAAKRAAWGNAEKTHLLEIIQDAEGPTKFVEVANRFAKEVAHTWDSRTAKAELRLRAFRLMGELVKEFLIARHKRKWVVYLGPDNPRRKAWHQGIEDTMQSFPKPKLTGC